MELTNEQHQALEKWIDDGMSLSDIQARLNEEFNLSFTYMEVRFLVDDLDLTLQDKPETSSSSANNALGSAEHRRHPLDNEKGTETLEDIDTPERGEDDFGDDFGSSLTVDVDRVMKPGSVVSGSVKFSDGVSSNWFIDQFGRLGLNPSQEGYQPSGEDLRVFQKELQIALQKHGL